MSNDSISRDRISYSMCWEHSQPNRNFWQRQLRYQEQRTQQQRYNSTPYHQQQSQSTPSAGNTRNFDRSNYRDDNTLQDNNLSNDSFTVPLNDHDRDWSRISFKERVSVRPLSDRNESNSDLNDSSIINSNNTSYNSVPDYNKSLTNNRHNNQSNNKNFRRAQSQRNITYLRFIKSESESFK